MAWKVTLSGNKLDDVSTLIESTRPEKTELEKPNSLLGELMESTQVHATLYWANDVIEVLMRQQKANQIRCR